jgi:hypothetical protein
MDTSAPFAFEPRPLDKQLEQYLHSLDDASCQRLGLPPAGKLAVTIRRTAGPIEVESAGEQARLLIDEDSAQRVIAYTKSCNWANGVVLVPTLARLVLAGAFDGLRLNESRELRECATRRKADPRPNLGLLWGAFNLLALAGWVTLDGGDEDARYRLTAAGASAVEYVAASPALFKRLADATAMLQHLHALFHRRRVNPLESDNYAGLVRLCRAGWPLPQPSNALGRQVRERMCTAMDGLLLGPTWIALDLPLYEEAGNRRAKAAPSILERFGERASGEWVELPRGWPQADADTLETAWSLMEHAGMVELDRTGLRVRLTQAGRVYRPIAAPYAGLPSSYLRSYAVLDELLFGDPDPLGIDDDGHIDRIMNVHASSGAGSGPASREITGKIIRRIFDETPLEDQPAGIADMGCGDATALKRIAEYVVRSTLRGRHLDDFPLLVVGADYNESARARATDTLAELAGTDGLAVRVLGADISDPDGYDAAVAASGLTVRDASGFERPARLRDLLHTNMFLLHNRRLTVRSRKEADAILGRSLRNVDPARLRAVIGAHFGTTLDIAHGTAPLTLTQLKAAFRVAHSDAQGLVPGYVAAADLIEMIRRWTPYVRHGFLAVEGHSPWAEHLTQPPGEPEHGGYMRTELLPAVFNWGMHFVSRQFMMPFNEYMLAMCLAGLSPRAGVYGRIHPEGFPGLDLLSDYRFFSIADYVPHAALDGSGGSLNP